jgi:hypothetical protein
MDVMDVIIALRKEMGDKFPSAWSDPNLLWRGGEQYNLRCKAFERLRKTMFKRCRPVTVEVRSR